VIKAGPRAVLALITALAFCMSAGAAEKVRVQLKWLHQFQFAGYYAALEKGYYRDAGLDAELIEGAPGVDPAHVVLEGRAEYGVGTPELLLARAAGEPIVVLGAIFQHSAYVFIAIEGTGIESIADLHGKRVMIEPQAAELYAYLRREQLPPDSLHIVPHTFSLATLTNKQVDAMSGYSTDEPFTLQSAHVPYLTFTPRAGGVDFYGDCFFTTESEIHAHPQRVRAFREATLNGWEYALKHPEEIIELLVTKYHSKKSREALAFEAMEMRDLIHPELIPVGYMYAGRWKHIMETYQELGMLKEPIDLDGFIYDPNPTTDLTWLYWVTGGALLLALATFGILLPVMRLNGRLKLEIEDRIAVEQMLDTARDASIRATQAKMEFVTHITHDLRTPVSSIIMQAELMDDGKLDPQRKEEVGVIKEAGEHLLTLVNDLLDMNRLEAGQIELANIPFKLEEALDPVVDVLGVAAKRKGIALTLSIPSDLPGLQGDPGRLRQILFNLAGNAVKFTDAGRVAIRASKTPAGWLRLEVADTGPGIEANDLAAIFDPFTRASGRKTRAKEGTGLGLAIVKRLAEAMGGRASVQSTVGAGSTFALELPILDRSP
jgi:signal transduction histidine kinase